MESVLPPEILKSVKLSFTEEEQQQIMSELGKKGLTIQKLVSPNAENELTEEEKNHVTSVMMQYVKQSSIF
jgi:hypothetical protein